MKPILFNTEMVKKILLDQKTVTRRVCKVVINDNEDVAHRICASVEYPARNKNGNCAHFLDTQGHFAGSANQPYRPGDILYVRETFQVDYLSNIPGTGRIHYKADDTYADFSFSPGRYDMMRRAQLRPGWRPNENMPREAARIFLRVTDVSVCRVQDITDEDARKEGCADREDFRRVWDKCYAKPRPVKGETGRITHYESYPWKDGQEVRTYKGRPWYVIGNPWVWGIAFERCEKPEEKR